ncbi:MAG TPA: sugar ABC transporter substrate-binding protein [bacterium]|nr:sugar ABC transporter substrate-binding protein [bacterium]
MRKIQGMGKGFLGALLLLGMLVQGCSKTSDALKISSWGDIKENTILQGLIDDFQKANPDIKVELQRVPWGEYNTKLLTQFAGGLAPDVIFASTDNIGDLYFRNVLEPLDPYIQSDPAYASTLKDFYPTLMNRFTVNGSLYVLPRDISPVCVLYYNKKEFQEAGLPMPSDDWDWTDFLKAAKALTKVDQAGRTTQWGITEDWAMIEPWVYSAGGRWVDNPQKPTKWAFDTPEFIKGLQFRADLMNKYKVMPSPANMTAMGGVGASDMFVNGTAAMFISGIWKTPQFRDIKTFDWDVALFPKGPGGTRGYQSGGSGYGILSTSKHKKEAWKLVSFLAGPEGEKKMASTGLVQPALMSVANSPVFLDGQKPLNKKILLKAEPYGIFMPLMVNWQEVYQGNVIPTFDNLWLGKTDAAGAVSQLWKKIKDRSFGTDQKGGAK